MKSILFDCSFYSFSVTSTKKLNAVRTTENILLQIFQEVQVILLTNLDRCGGKDLKKISFLFLVK